jgi:hypothetical protein
MADSAQTSPAVTGVAVGFGGNAAEGNQTASAGAGSGSISEKAATSPRSRKSKGSNVVPLYGSRTIKQYPIQEQELDDLFRIDFISTLCFSGASAFLSVFLNVVISLSFAAADVPASTRSFWWSVGAVCFVLFVILAVTGVAFIYIRKGKVAAIKNETAFEG